MWTILLLESSNDWYIDYINEKLNFQIKSNELEQNINVLVINDIDEIKYIKNLGEYVNIINNGDISNDYIEIIYKTLEKTDKNCICFYGIYKDDDECFVFNQKEETEEEIFIPINKMNPMKKNFILKNFSNYVDDIFKKISTYFIDDVIVYVESDINLNRMVDQETKEPFSIILTAYKTQMFIEECLDSIENQTYFIDNNNYEILIGVDGCEETFNKLNEIKHKYRNLKIYMMKENYGTYMTTNALLDLIKYENVIRFDTDDIMEPNLVEDVVDFKNINDDDVIKLGYSDWKNGKNISKYTFINDGIIYFKKSVMDNIAGGYMPWECAADSELMARLKGRVKIARINKKLFIRRIHDNSLTIRKDTGYRSSKRLEYNKQIKSKYNDDEVKIDRIKGEFKNNINVIYLITTYNRIDFLKETIDSWHRTHNRNYKWTLIIADDGSTNGTKDYLSKLYYDDVNIIIINNNRRGVHHQTNSLFKFIENIDYDYGFKSDDDIIFLKSGWDDLYIDAINETHYDHLIFYDMKWGNRRNEIIKPIFKGRYLVNHVKSENIQGAFWTFTKDVINKVGFIDIENFGLCGLGHIDFSFRCCRCGFNDINNPFDIINSNDYIKLNDEKYFSNNLYREIWNTPDKIKNKKKLLNQLRTYIPYNEIPFKMNGEKIHYINEYFNNIYCLNLDRRPDKWEQVKKRFDNLGINVERFSAVDGNTLDNDILFEYNKINKYEIGCILSHYNIIKDAKKRCFEKILILEDDVIFINNFHEEFKKFMNNIGEWKILYLGSSQYMWGSVEFNDGFYKSKTNDGTFAYAIHESVYDRILETSLIKNRPIDNKLWDLQNELYEYCYTAYPNLIIADVKDSDIRGSRDGENHHLRMRWDLKKYENIDT